MPMLPAIAEHDLTVYQGDATTVLAHLEPGSVQCCVTSPPYYGLRDYGTGKWEGGADGCDHQKVRDPAAAVATSTLGGGKKSTGHLQEGYADSCGRCGARRVDQQIGLEPSPAEYVETMRTVFAAVRRVLAADGVLWLNLGDSYSGGNRTTYHANSATKSARSRGHSEARPLTGVAAKNLLGIPWRVAFALQDDGWTLRNAVIWHKPNAMPESVTDRLSTRYEHVFLFSKSRRYWFNLDAIKEPLTKTPEQYAAAAASVRANHAFGRVGGTPINATSFATVPSAKNPSDVWEIATSPFPGAHFACMPPELARRCILAGSPEGATVLDPFAGSGTTLMVARQLARRGLGVELNPGYVDIIRARVGDPPFEFADPPPAPAPAPTHEAAPLW